MIRAASSSRRDRRGLINPLSGEFQTSIDGTMCRFDTRLATIAAIETACGDRAIVEVLNGVILGRRAKDQIAVIAAALAAVEPGRDDAEERAARATVNEAEAFVLALVFALGFSIASSQAEARADGRPFDGPSAGANGESSRSAA
ncbi:hypothetical protein [Lichenihabitans psoromatis]|uniref:hypothetical protein n=1 Tax=Lichenihabitans psoromatis TaxID=2528642 RepID=UPI00103858CF|nr:hypothetical protein [Lichenihabitans psoromatis]